VSELLYEGRPLVVASEHDRIGRGAWARLFASGVIGDESSSVAEQGRARARTGDVHSVRVAEGELSAVVGECTVTLSADPIPPRIWSTVARSARRNARMLDGIEGREQSVHLEHLMRFEWDEPLIPDRSSLRRVCSCDADRVCEHVVAVAYVVADQIDRDPRLLLRWRGIAEVVEEEEEPEPTALLEPVAADDDPWQAGPLPTPRPARPLPVGAILNSLGPSGIRAAAGELEDALQRAYASFAKK
jgi:uncharacterized Zn finger protein